MQFKNLFWFLIFYRVKFQNLFFFVRISFQNFNKIFAVRSGNKIDLFFIFFVLNGAYIKSSCFVIVNSQLNNILSCFFNFTQKIYQQIASVLSPVKIDILNFELKNGPRKSFSVRHLINYQFGFEIWIHLGTVIIANSQ